MNVLQLLRECERVTCLQSIIYYQNIILSEEIQLRIANRTFIYQISGQTNKMNEFLIGKLELINRQNVLPHKLYQKMQSKFDTLYSQAFSEVKKRLGSFQQDVTILKMKSYQSPKTTIDQIKGLKELSERSEKLVGTLTKHSSLIPISTARARKNLSHRNQITPKQSQFNIHNNKALWERKKPSLQMLRSTSIGSNNALKSKLQRQLSKELPKQSFKHLRQRTTIDHEDSKVQKSIMMSNYNFEEEDNSFQSQITIYPLSLNYRQERQKYLKMKKKLLQKFKIITNQVVLQRQRDKKQSQPQRKTKIQQSNWNKKYGRSMRRKNWQTDKQFKQQQDFINFVEQKVKLKSETQQRNDNLMLFQHQRVLA